VRAAFGIGGIFALRCLDPRTALYQQHAALVDGKLSTGNLTKRSGMFSSKTVVAKWFVDTRVFSRSTENLFWHK
jgi:hypothetical protein